MPPEAPAKIPVAGQSGAGFRDDKLAVATSGVESPAQPSLAGRASAPGEAAGAPCGRLIIRRATLECELSDVDRGISRLAEIIEAAGGHLADTQGSTDMKGTAQATITAYVPPDQFGRTIAALEGPGRVTSRRIAGQDVSEECVDLEARVRGETERRAGRIRFLKARTEMATIQIALVRAPLAAPPGNVLARVWEQVRTAFLEAWCAAFRAATALLVLAAQATPLAVPALAAWAVSRRWARRRPVPPTPASPAVGAG